MTASVRVCESLQDIIKKFDQNHAAAANKSGGEKCANSVNSAAKFEWRKHCGRMENIEEKKECQSAYEELNLSRPSEQQLYKNDKNFTLSVKELQERKKKKRRQKREILKEDVSAAVAKLAEDDDDDDDILDVVVVDDSALDERVVVAPPQQHRKLHFDVVTRGSRSKERKTESGYVWNKSKVILLLWTVVALVLWIIAYMILRLVYVI